MEGQGGAKGFWRRGLRSHGARSRPPQQAAPSTSKNLTIPSSRHHTHKVESQAPVAGVQTRQEGCRPSNIIVLGEEPPEQKGSSAPRRRSPHAYPCHSAGRSSEPSAAIPLHPISPADLLVKGGIKIMKAPETTRKRLLGGGGSIRAWLDGKKADKGEEDPRSQEGEWPAVCREVAVDLEKVEQGWVSEFWLAWRSGMERSCMVPWTKSGIRGTKRGERGQRSGQGPEVFSRIKRAG